MEERYFPEFLPGRASASRGREEQQEEGPGAIGLQGKVAAARGARGRSRPEPARGTALLPRRRRGRSACPCPVWTPQASPEPRARCRVLTWPHAAWSSLMSCVTPALPRSPAAPRRRMFFAGLGGPTCAAASTCWSDVVPPTSVIGRWSVPVGGDSRGLVEAELASHRAAQEPRRGPLAPGASGCLQGVPGLRLHELHGDTLTEYRRRTSVTLSPDSASMPPVATEHAAPQTRWPRSSLRLMGLWARVWGGLRWAALLQVSPGSLMTWRLNWDLSAAVTGPPSACSLCPSVIWAPPPRWGQVPCRRATVGVSRPPRERQGHRGSVRATMGASGPPRERRGLRGLGLATPTPPSATAGGPGAERGGGGGSGLPSLGGGGAEARFSRCPPHRCSALGLLFAAWMLGGSLAEKVTVSNAWALLCSSREPDGGSIGSHRSRCLDEGRLLI